MEAYWMNADSRSPSWIVFFWFIMPFCPLLAVRGCEDLPESQNFSWCHIVEILLVYFKICRLTSVHLFGPRVHWFWSVGLFVLCWFFPLGFYLTDSISVHRDICYSAQETDLLAEDMKDETYVSLVSARCVAAVDKPLRWLTCRSQVIRGLQIMFWGFTIWARTFTYQQNADTRTLTSAIFPLICIRYVNWLLS